MVDCVAGQGTIRLIPWEGREVRTREHAAERDRESTATCRPLRQMKLRDRMDREWYSRLRQENAEDPVCRAFAAIASHPLAIIFAISAKIFAGDEMA